MKKFILFIFFQTIISPIFSESITRDNINRDTRRKDIANVYWNSEYTLFDLQTDEAIFPDNNGLYDIWYSSNEDPTPNYKIFSRQQLSNLHFYKFKNRENCLKWCESRNTDSQINNSYEKSNSNEGEGPVEVENIPENTASETDDIQPAEKITESSIITSNDYKPSNVVEYYKADKDIPHITIYLDHKFSSDDYNLISEYQCIPYTDDVHQEASELSQNLFSNTVVEIIEIHGKYGKININKKDWWIRLESLVKLSDTEVQKYLNKKISIDNRNEFVNLKVFLKDKPTLKWISIIGLILIFILEFSIKKK